MKSEKNINRNETEKRILPCEGENSVCLDYTDHVSFNKKQFTLDGSGEKLKIINAFFLDYLNAYNIITGYKGTVDKGIIFEKHSRYPFCVKIQNVADKENAKVFGVKEGTPLQTSLITFLYNSSFSISDSHFLAYNICPLEEIKMIRRICSKVNVVLKSYFERRNLSLSEILCYFGFEDNRIYVVDDFTSLSIKLKSEVKGLFKEPYKISTANDFAVYTDFFINLIKS
ncbi:MAG: hypothetical protein C4539_09075 [Ignavibacteriales bacterium]|nr:MAG: hypothetical protein C4539_09075 [Ignavibacteriales bacterium]